MKKELENLYVLYDSVLVKPSESNNKTSSGLYVPESANSDNILKSEVVRVGEGTVSANGAVVPNRLKVGDTVFYLKRDAAQVKVDDAEYHVVKENVILLYQRNS